MKTTSTGEQLTANYEATQDDLRISIQTLMDACIRHGEANAEIIALQSTYNRYCQHRQREMKDACIEQGKANANVMINQGVYMMHLLDARAAKKACKIHQSAMETLHPHNPNLDQT